MNERKKISEYSIVELRVICQATAPDPSSESYVGRFCRIFSIYATKMFLYTKISPNQITILSVLVFFAGIALFFVGTYDYNISACILVWLSIVFDGSDGEVARFRQRKSFVGGVYTEPVSHDIQYGFSFLLMGIAFYLNTGAVYYLVLGALASIFKLEFRFLKMHFAKLIQLIKLNNPGNDKTGEATKNLLTIAAGYLNRNLFSSTGFLLTIFFLSLIDRVVWSLWFYAIGYALFWVSLFAKQILIVIKNKY
jgi:phosphatidylglycerophosphate synthase